MNKEEFINISNFLPIGIRNEEDWKELFHELADRFFEFKDFFEKNCTDNESKGFDNFSDWKACDRNMERFK